MRCAQEFVPRLFGGAHVECLFQGNVTAQHALEMAEGVRSTVSRGVLLASQRPLDAVTRLLPGRSLLHRCALRVLCPAKGFAVPGAGSLRT